MKCILYKYIYIFIQKTLDNGFKSRYTSFTDPEGSATKNLFHRNIETNSYLQYNKSLFLVFTTVGVPKFRNQF